MRQWNIGIISTDYDLKKERNIIASFLEKYKEINILAFERPNYPVDPHVHSHEACLNVVDLMDIAFIIINKRYGGFYIGDNNISITHAEIEKLYIQNKIIIPIVNQNAWDERHRFFSSYKEQDTELLDEFISHYKFLYVDNFQVISLIDTIHKNTQDNFIIFYDKPEELLEKIQGRLKGLTRHFCKEIVKKQINEIRNKKTFLSFNQSLGDMFDKHLYINPNIQVLTGTLTSRKFEENILLRLSEKEKILVLGEPGAGKSTLLSKMFLNYVNKFVQINNDIPLYIQLRGKNKESKLSIIDFYAESFEVYLNKPLFPFCDFTILNFCVFLDGLDEMSDAFDSQDITQLAEADILRFPTVLTCRTKYAYIYFESTVLGNKFNQILLLKKWLPKNAKAYIKKYTKNLPQHIKENILRIANSDVMLSMLDNPLITNLILFTISEGNLNVPFSFRDQADSLRYAIEMIASREAERHGFVLKENQYLSIWMDISWRLYRSRGSDENVYIDDIADFINGQYPHLDNVSINNIIMSIFDTNLIRNSIVGCIHEQIMEYLVASYLLEAILNETFPYPDFLGLVIRPEINHLIIAKYNSLSKKLKDNIFDKLFSEYHKLVLEDSEYAVMKRVRIIYYLTRMYNTRGDEMINYVRSIENNDLVKISMYSGCIKQGNLELEEEFYSKLSSDSKFLSLYMGYHLVYYNDVTDKEITYPYLDNCLYGWSRTYATLYKQFIDSHKEYYYMMRIEIYIICKFMETRKDIGSITLQDIGSIERVMEYSEYFDHDKEYCNKVRKSLCDMRELYVQYNKVLVDI